MNAFYSAGVPVLALPQKTGGRGSTVHQAISLGFRLTEGAGRGLRCVLPDDSVETGSLDRPFETKVRQLVAEGDVSAKIGKQLLRVHKETKKGESK